MNDIINALEDKHVTGILIDTYAGASTKRLGKPHLRVHQVFGMSSTYGVILAGDSRKLTRCFHSYHNVYAEKISRHVERNTDQLEVRRSLCLPLFAFSFVLFTPVTHVHNMLSCACSRLSLTSYVKYLVRHDAIYFIFLIDKRRTISIGAIHGTFRK